jgi:hypothetical protein
MHESIVAGPAPNWVPIPRFAALFGCKVCWLRHSRGLSQLWSRESGQWAKAAGAGFPFPRSRFGFSK